MYPSWTNMQRLKKNSLQHRAFSTLRKHTVIDIAVLCFNNNVKTRFKCYLIFELVMCWERDHCSTGGHALPRSHLYVYCYLRPQSSRGAMTWNLSATFSCTSTWAHSLGRASRLLPRGRSMNGSVRRKCPHPLRFSVKDTHVSVFWGPEVCTDGETARALLSSISRKCYCCEDYVTPVFNSWFQWFSVALCWTLGFSHFIFSFVFLQPSSPHIWTFAVRCVSTTSQITLIYASFSGISSIVRVSPMITSLIGTCSNL